MIKLIDKNRTVQFPSNLKTVSIVPAVLIACFLAIGCGMATEDTLRMDISTLREEIRTEQTRLGSLTYRWNKQQNVRQGTTIPLSHQHDLLSKTEVTQDELETAEANLERKLKSFTRKKTSLFEWRQATHVLRKYAVTHEPDSLAEFKRMTHSVKPDGHLGWDDLDREAWDRHITEVYRDCARYALYGGDRGKFLWFSYGYECSENYELEKPEEKE